MTWEQTAEVLAKEVDRLQKENDRLNAWIQEATSNNALENAWEQFSMDFGDDYIAFRDAVHSIFPTAEGGGAANGGESQALQAAILGLHTLAGEFPTAMFETRKDYLQATISEINEILGKQ